MTTARTKPRTAAYDYALVTNGELILYGILDPEGPLASKDVFAALPMTNDPLNVRINSPGGSLTEAVAIYNMLKHDRRRVIVHVDSMAASGGGLIAMAGDEIIIAEGAQIMLHNPYANITGTSGELAKAAATVAQQCEQMISIYASRTGRSRAEIRKLMDEETYLDARAAVAMGFADRLAAPMKIAACERLTREQMALYVEKDIQMSTSTHTATADTAASAAAATAERTRILEIQNLVRESKLPDALADELIAKKVPIEAATTRIIGDWSAQLRASEGSPNPIRAHVSEASLQNPAFLASALTDAMYNRIAGKAPAAGAPSAEFSGMSYLDLECVMAEARGDRSFRKLSRAAQADKVLNTMAAGAGLHSTSDFPNIGLSGGVRFLQETFDASQSALRQLAHEREVPDFRPVSLLQMSETPELRIVPEGSEIESVTIGESGQTIRVLTYGSRFNATRQVIINDDLNAFGKFFGTAGRGAASTEARLLSATFLENGGLGSTLSDGMSLYHTGHRNIAPVPAALSVDSLGLDRKLMRDQLGLDGTTPIGFAPRWLIVGSAQETAAEKVLAQLAPAKMDDANPFSGKLQLGVEARLPGLAWRLFADPAVMPVIEIVHLRGSGGRPSVEMRNGWEILGTEIRVVHDVGVALTEFRGTTLNTGL
jgi:ATP-dependent protease ClpP protease subunit